MLACDLFPKAQISEMVASMETMAGRLLAGVVLAVALGGVAPAAGDQSPILRSATVRDHGVVLAVAVGDVRPVQLTVATSRAVDGDGALRRDVRLREAIQLAPSAIGVVRWQSRKKLSRGIYFVQVIGGRLRRRDGLSTSLPADLSRALVERATGRRHGIGLTDSRAPRERGRQRRRPRCVRAFR